MLLLIIHSMADTRKYQIVLKSFNLVVRISMYATTSTEDSLYIFGGWTVYSQTNAGRISNIAKYKNNQWSEVGNLNTPRFGHSVITSGSLTFIIGGCECINPGQP